MRILILSDLHLEFAPFDPPKVQADVVILAGDIHVGKQGLQWALEAFEEIPVLYVLGNHEFYHHSFPSLIDHLKGDAAGTNVRILENDRVRIGDTTFLGCTLWTDFALFGEPELGQLVAANSMMDYGVVQSSRTYRKLRPAETLTAHRDSLDWLKKQGIHSAAEKRVVITHHAPSSKSIPPIHKAEPLSAAFASNLEETVAESGAVLWIHGHTHRCVDYKTGPTRVLSNQRGYPGEGTGGFDPALVIEI